MCQKIQSADLLVANHQNKFTRHLYIFMYFLRKTKVALYSANIHVYPTTLERNFVQELISKFTKVNRYIQTLHTHITYYLYVHITLHVYVIYALYKITLILKFLFVLYVIIMTVICHTPQK